MKIRIYAVLIAVFFISGCFLGDKVPQEDKNVKTDKYNTLAVENIADEKKSITEGSNKFASELFKQLRDNYKDSNFFFSPYSIYLAYSMLFEGASGETSKELSTLFAFSEDDFIRREAIQEELSKYQNKKQKYGIFVSNSLWANKDFTILPPYKTVLHKYYFADVYEQMDFSKTSSTDRINKWVGENTENKIKKIVNDTLDANTAFVLVNTIFFKEKWQIAFDKSSTEDDDFYVPGENKVTIKLMKQKDKYMYYENKDIQAIRMSYQNESKKSMIAVISKSGGVNIAEDFILNNDISFFFNNMTLQSGIVYFPKFETEWNSDLAKIMVSLGLLSSDYSKLSSDDCVVSNVLHSSFIKIDEEETEAAAATAIVLAKGIYIEREEPPFVFRADKPFVYMIIDEEDGKILFMGKMFKPQENKGK